MFEVKKYILFTLICVYVFSKCRNDESGDRKTKLIVRIQAAYHKKIYLQLQPLNDEKLIKLDSGMVQSGLDSFVFYIPAGEERLYNISVAGSSINLPVITDTKSIEIYYNYATHKYSVKHSPASEELKEFTDKQLELAKNIRAFKLTIDSLKRIHSNFSSINYSTAKLNNMTANFFNRYKNFADTVSSPAAFLAVYDAIDFGNDRVGLKKFITVSAARFPNNSGVQTLQKNVLDYLKIFNEQYNIGDTLPELILPDQYGFNFSTYSLKGKYVLLNIWSTFCDSCTKYMETIKKVKQQFPSAKFEAVSIALDDQRQAWLNIIQEKNYNWPQLIDEKMWNGVAFKTLKFETIPYNFLVDPDGRLIAKNIKPDLISIIIQRNIK